MSARLPVARFSTGKAAMTPLRRLTDARSGVQALAFAAVGLGALALANRAVARRAERKHPPKGSFIVVDGVRLHYSDRGVGYPVVLIHGNAVDGDDYNNSGVAERLLGRHRVIIFDRPGFGYSERSHGRLWTAQQQATLLAKALQQLGIERPVVVGHSWGAMVALALAEQHPADVAGLVLLSGYYFWTLRPDVLLVGAGALPVLGDVLRYTLSPLLGWLTMPLLKRMLFSPAAIPTRFNAEYSPAMALRPWQIRATAEDGALMIPSALSLHHRYQYLAMPVVIMAGDGDKVVFYRLAERLQASIKGSVLHIVKDAGHMIHHLVPGQVADAVEAVTPASSGGADKGSTSALVGAPL
jgi:pimeloyl-ACP methyl ester carboxylesterase